MKYLHQTQRKLSDCGVCVGADCMQPLTCENVGVLEEAVATKPSDDLLQVGRVQHLTPGTGIA